MIARAGAIAALVLAVLPIPAGGQPAPVRVDEVITEPMRQTVPVLGRIVATRRGEVAARVSGPVKEVYVDVGDRVEKDERLAAIAEDWLMLEVKLRRAAHREAVATVERERASVAIARQALARLERLKETAAFNAARFEDAEQELAQALGNVGAAEARQARAGAELGTAVLDLANAAIAAPYAGVVIERHAQPGAYLTVGSPVVTLIDDTSMEIEAEVPVERIAGLAPGVAVRAVPAAGGELEAQVRAIVPEENPMTRTRAVRFTADFEGLDAPPAAGESVTVHVPSGPSRTVLTVHKDAVTQGPRGAIVFVVVDGEAQIRPVTLAAAIGERFEVASGLEAGDKVVVRGNERLQPGQKVSF